MLGGMSWQSTLLYYELVNAGIQRHLGRSCSAEILLVSVNFSEIEKLQKKSDWVSLKNIFLEKSKILMNGGAEAIVICTNTMHKLVGELEPHIEIPYLHIVDALAEELKLKKVKKVALIGTKFVMQEDFYKNRLNEQGDFSIVVPEKSDQETIHDIIFSELCQGDIKKASQRKYLTIIDKMRRHDGIEGLILGCTEICLLIEPKDTPIPIFDTTKIHCEKIVNWAISP